VTTTVFLLAAFLAPGAWLIVRIPTVEKAQLCFLLATLVCAALVCAKMLPLRRPASGALLAASLVTAAFLLALVTNAFPVQQFLYDLYGEMPGFVWLCYPVVFLLAASIGLGSWARPALRAVTLVGLLLIAVALYQRFFTSWINVFGSSAYNVSALIPIPVLALWLATVDTHRRAKIVWRMLALAAAAAIVVISYGMLGIFAVIALVLLIAALRPQLVGLPEGRLCGGVRIGGRIALALLVAALIVVLLPQTSGLVIKRQNLASLGSTVGSRIEFSYTAEAMVAKRPLTGYGPAGFRFSAYRFLDKWVYGDTGTIGSDPVAYSPPSPHNLPWEVATRLGLIGVVAVLAAGWFWLRAWRASSVEDPGDEAASVPGSLVDLRAVCVIAALAWLLSLFVTPMHFASGLLGAALAGLACARPQAIGMDALALPSAARTFMRGIGCVALVVLAILFSRQQLAVSSATQTVVSTAADGVELMENAAKTVPTHPMVARQLLDYRLLQAKNVQELDSQIQAVQTAPGYVADFTLNYTQFAQIALNQIQSFQSSDTAQVKSLLQRAASAGPVTPALLGEQLHLAVVSGNTSAIQQATAEVRRPLFNGKTAEQLYPPITDYLATDRSAANTPQ